MSNDFLKMSSDVENEVDRIGGSYLANTGAYTSVIEAFYLGEADSGARSITVHAKTQDGVTLRETLWISSGKAKGYKNTFEKDGKKYYLPGFNIATAIALLTVGKSLDKLNIEEKVIKLYDREQSKEVPTKVNMFTDVVGQKIILGVHKVLSNKQKKVGDKYVPTAETYESNEIDKIFREKDRMTVAELRAKETEPAFYEKWVDKFDADFVKDTTTKVSGSSSNNSSSDNGMPEDEEEENIFG